MTLSQHVRDFLSNPFDPNNDGKTSVLELFAAFGLVVIIGIAWHRILRVYVEA